MSSFTLVLEYGAAIGIMLGPKVPFLICVHAKNKARSKQSLPQKKNSACATSQKGLLQLHPPLEGVSDQCKKGFYKQVNSGRVNRRRQFQFYFHKIMSSRIKIKFLTHPSNIIIIIIVLYCIVLYCIVLYYILFQTGTHPITLGRVTI